MTMPGTSILNPHPPEFERFLYATVGEDLNGSVVTVLSTLARLDLDPWKETAELVMLGRDAARLRLERVLAGFLDVPALMTDHGTVARELCLLLPERPPKHPLSQADSSATIARLASSRTLWAILAIILVLAQILFNAAPGSDK